MPSKDSLSPTPASPPPPPPPRLLQPGHVKGQWVIVATLSLFVVVPLLVWILVSFTPSPTVDWERPLVWDDRASWPVYPAQPISIKSGLMRQMRGAKEWKKVEFTLPLEEELAMQEASGLAKQSDAFTQPQTLTALKDLDAKLDGHFYTRYLMARHHELRGEMVLAAQHDQEAFALAPVAMVIRYLRSDDRPAVQQRPATLAFGLDRVEDDRRNATLVLVYPMPLTNDQGKVYLPTFRTVYRETDPELAAGLAPPDEGWFAFPGRVGRLKDRPLEPVAPER